MTAPARPTASDRGTRGADADGRVIERLMDDSVAAPVQRPESSGGPNIVLILLDDVGFGSCAAFGGPVPMPALDRVAQRGLRYNQFHTTAVCSPTRASLLTGRNHHSVHMGAIPEGANSFPGYDTVMPRSAATVAEVLRRNGYSTGCFGKWHLTPTWEHNPAGPFERWPTGMGFERFYGIIGAEASMYEPAVYDQTTPIEPHLGRPDYHLSEDLADQASTWIRRQQAAAPDRPFLCYFSTPAVHAPHHVWPSWIERFAGRFDDGWDALRVEIHARQLEMGVIPAGTRLTPRPEQIPSWDDYPDRYKPVARRLMEVFAAFLAHTDAQIGRVLDTVHDLGIADDTLVIYLTGDNGASAEGTIHGAWSAPSFQNGIHEDPEWLLAHMDDFGSARCENHFNVGWAWALDAPFQWMKQVASHFGGTRNGMAISWPHGLGPGPSLGPDDDGDARAGEGTSEGGGLRSQFHHVIDIAPTIMEAAGIEVPTEVDGVDQLPMHGRSMAYTFTPEAADAKAVPSPRTTQYFELLGNRALYHDGWIASCFHGRVPWIRLDGFEFDGPQERWELYRITDDFSQSVDLAAEHPEKLAELQARFDAEARAYGVYPLRDPGSRLTADHRTPRSLGSRRRMTYTPAHVRLPEWSVVNLKNASHEITAEVVVPPAGATGVIACQGGNMAGWSLYLDEAGVPHYLYNCFGHELTTVRGDRPLASGRHMIKLFHDHEGGFGAGGTMHLFVDGAEVDQARVDRTVPIVFSMSGETFDVGVDTGAPVGPYRHGYRCTAEIIGVTLERLTDPDPAVRAAMAEGEFAAAMSSQ